MLVVIAGLPRSGSTWSFNAARLLLLSGGASVYGDWVEDVDESINLDHTIIKAHGVDEDLARRADVILSSHRDIRDIIVSMRAMGWLDWDKAVFMADIVRGFHDGWSPLAHLDLPYQAIASTPERALHEVASALDVDLTTRQAQAILAAMPTKNASVSARGHDPVSLLHPNHINNGVSGRWRDEMPPGIAHEILERHGDWLGAHGYA